MTRRSNPEFSRPVAIADLQAGETLVEIAAAADERAALAARLALVALDRLEASLRVALEANRTVARLSGELRAEVVQSCVVTLEPVRSSIRATFHRRYGAAPATGLSRADHLGFEDEDEPLERLEGGTFDAGEAVAEQLTIEIDPFPRQSGVEFAGYSTAAEAARPSDSPFAVLAALRPAKAQPK